MSTVTDLKRQWAHFLCQPSDNYIPKGLITDHKDLNHFLPWGGIPRGGITLIQAPQGCGATSLWLGSIKNLTQQKRWAAWINGNSLLCPTALNKKGVDLDYFINLTTKNNDIKKWFWLLQELISHQIFDSIGCDITDLALKDFHLRKLLPLIEREQVALVFLSSKQKFFQRNHFELILQMNAKNLIVEKAKQRPTPHILTTHHLAEIVSTLPIHISSEQQLLFNQKRKSS